MNKVISQAEGRSLTINGLALSSYSPMFQGFIKSLDLLMNNHGYVSLPKLMGLMRNNSKVKIDEYLAQFENVEKMYKLMNEVHSKDKRQQINPQTQKKYPFISHTTGAAAILAMIGYSPDIIASELGHDLYDHNRETKEPLDTVLRDFCRKIVEIIKSATYVDHDVLWDVASNDLEIKGNALMHRLYWIINRPEGIAIAGADRLHNLLSISDMPVRSRRRTIAETIQVYLPLLKHYDETLYLLIKEVLNPVTPGDLYLAKPDQLLFSQVILKNYADCRNNFGITNISFSQKFEKLKHTISEGLHNHILKTELPTFFKSELNRVEHPNLPKYNPKSTIAKQLRKDYQEIISMIGKGYEIGMDEEIYNYTGWAIPLEEVLGNMMTFRINKRFLQDYFQETQIVGEIDFDPMIVQRTAMQYQLEKVCAIKTSSGDEVNLIEINYDGPIMPVLHFFRQLQNLNSEMAVYDEGENIVAIYEPNDLYDGYTKGQSGATRADIPHRPFTKIVIKGGYF